MRWTTSSAIRRHPSARALTLTGTMALTCRSNASAISDKGFILNQLSFKGGYGISLPLPT